MGKLHQNVTRILSFEMFNLLYGEIRFSGADSCKPDFKHSARKRERQFVFKGD